MSLAPQVSFSPNRILFARAVRRFLWPHPALYFPIGIARKRGNVFGTGADIYISGYPRSGNTFARTAFLSANPGTGIQSHRHIPTFVLQKVRSGVPGIVLIRKPLDAAVSWSIHSGQSMEEAIAYWNDYYEALMPVRSKLFVATFGDVTGDFGAVMRSFNEFWDTSFVPFTHTKESANDCFQVTEEQHRKPSGEIREMQVCRPSSSRRKLKEKYLRQVPQSRFLRDELSFADDIFRAFVNYSVRPDRETSGSFVPASQESASFPAGALG